MTYTDALSIAAAHSGIGQTSSDHQLLLFIAQELFVGPYPTGAGSPEGVITSSVGGFYRNTTDNSRWFKQTGSGTTGWTRMTSAVDQGLI